MTKDAAQRRRWTFYEAIKVCQPEAELEASLEINQTPYTTWTNSDSERTGTGEGIS